MTLCSHILHILRLIAYSLVWIDRAVMVVVIINVYEDVYGAINATATVRSVHVEKIHLRRKLRPALRITMLQLLVQ